MTVQTTFVGGVNPWANLFELAPQQKLKKLKEREVRHIAPKVKRKLKVGNNEYPNGGTKIYESLSDILVKINADNFIKCEPDEANRLGNYIRKWYAYRGQRVNIITCSRFGRVSVTVRNA